MAWVDAVYTLGSLCEGFTGNHNSSSQDFIQAPSNQNIVFWPKIVGYKSCFLSRHIHGYASFEQ